MDSDKNVSLTKVLNLIEYQKSIMSEDSFTFLILKTLIEKIKDL